MMILLRGTTTSSDVPIYLHTQRNRFYVRTGHGYLASRPEGCQESSNVPKVGDVKHPADPTAGPHCGYYAVIATRRIGRFWQVEALMTRRYLFLIGTNFRNFTNVKCDRQNLGPHEVCRMIQRQRQSYINATRIRI